MQHLAGNLRLKKSIQLQLMLALSILLGAGAPVSVLTIEPVHLQTMRNAPLHSDAASGYGLQAQSSFTADDGSALAPWPEFHGGAERDGQRWLNTQIDKADAASLVSVTGPAFTNTGMAMSSPAIYHDVLYYTIEIPKSYSVMYAVDAITGLIIWSEPFPRCGQKAKLEKVYSSPAVTTGVVNGVVMTEVFIGWSGDGRGCVYDFNGQSGAVIWTYATPNEVWSSPAIMSTDNGPIVVVGDLDDYVRAFSVNYLGTVGDQGTQLWEYDNRNDPPPPGFAKYCKDPREKCGDAVWSSPAEGEVMVNGTLHHYAYFGVGASPTHIVGRVDAIDMDTIVNNSPTLAWSFWDSNPQPDNDFGTVLVYADQSGLATRVFSGNNNGEMFGIDAASGQMDFDFSTSAQLGNIETMIHSTGTLVKLHGAIELIFGAGCSPASIHYTCKGPQNGYIWAIDALSTTIGGTPLWHSQDFGGDIVSSPIAVNQGANAVVFVLGPWFPGLPQRGDLLAIDPTNGSLVGDYPIFNQAFGAVSSPAVYGGRVYVTQGYNIYGKHLTGGGLAAFRCTTCL